MGSTYTRYPRSILWLIPGGQALIGGGEAGSSPPFSVEVAPFYISKFPITNLQYEAYDDTFERSADSAGDDDPAIGLSWRQARGYCDWYAAITRKPIRLPSEIEWEYACRAHSRGRYFWGENQEEADEYLWDRRNCPGPLGRLADKKANEFGLFAMLGGVWEWTASPSRPYPLRAATESAGKDENRILRGGSWKEYRGRISCWRRRSESPDARPSDAGFRIARSFRIATPDSRPSGIIGDL